MSWIGRLIGRRRLEADLDRELRFHVDEETTRLLAQGVDPAEARRQALAAFGGFTPMREATRDARGTRWFEDLAADLRLAFRIMRKRPGFALTAILSLGIGIGANAAVFSVTDALVRRPLPVARPDELTFLSLVGDPEPIYRFSGPEVQTLQARVPEATTTAMTPIVRLQASLDGHQALVDGQLVDGNFFSLLGVGASAGRVLTADDTRTVGGTDVVVLSHAFWDRQFGGDARVVGAPLVLNGRRLTIAGIAAEGFTGLLVGEEADLWVPVTLQHELRYRGNADISTGDPTKPWWTEAGIDWLIVPIRIPGGREMTGARVVGAERASIEQFAATIGAADRADLLRHQVRLEPGARGMSSLRGTFGPALTVLSITVALVLLVACANLASLLLARGTAREREFALRLSIGARRGRLVRQMLTESLVVALLGGALGLAFALGGAHALLSLASSSPTPIPLAVALDWRLIGFGLAVSLATGMLFGLGPAVRLSRTSVQEALRPGTRSVGGGDGRGVLTIGRGLVIAQVGLSLALLIGAALFTRTLGRLLAADLGFDERPVVGARFDLLTAGVPPAEWPDLNQRLLEAARAIPGVTRATLALNGPLGGGARVSGIVIAGEPPLTGRDGDAREEYVGPDYFATLGTTRLAGRDFADDDDARHPLVAIVNETFVRRFLHGQRAVGHRLGYGPDTPVDIIGVVRDARVDGATKAAPAEVYYPLRQYPAETARHLYVRLASPSGASAATAAGIRAAIASADRRLAVSDVSTLDALSARSLRVTRIVSELTGVFGLLAVAVACLGLFGTLSYAVSRRTQEIGVRLAIGAEPWTICRAVLGDALTLVAIGCGVGIGLSLLGQTAIASLLYGLSPRDPATFALATALLLAVAFLAALVPAWRASRIDPLRALRSE